MAATEAQMQAMQEAEDIDTGVDTRTKEEMLAEQMAGLKSTGKFIGETAVESIPGVSQAIGVKRTSDALEEDDYVGAGIEGTALVASMFPGIGPAAAKGLRKFNKTRKAYKVAVQSEDKKLYPLFVNADKELPIGEWIEADFPKSTFKGKRTPGSEEKNYVPTKGAKRTKGEKVKNTGDPIIIPDEATRKVLIEDGFITERTKRTKEAPFGKVTAVAARPGLHASQAPVATHLGPQDLKVTKKEVDKLLEAGVTPEAIKRRGNQYYVKRRAEDQVFVEVEMADDVDYQSMLAKEGRSDINDRVPKGGSYKYSDGQADSDQWVVGGDMKINRVLSREETRAIQKEMGVVDLTYRDEVEIILDKKFAKGGVVMDDYLVAKMMDENDSRQKFAEGGMPKQMEMFEDGGLKDEGGTIDPVSGNDVPPGSTQEEVRDDIPAQLSEGEFVFPADVVRYIGLGNLMRIRQEAKMGLKMMDEMGQMGNSDEATMPDDLPFDINDLDMEDELEYNVGGFVPGTVEQQQYGISGMQQATAPTTGVAAVPQQAASSQYVQPLQAAVPTTPVYTPAEIPTFKGFVGENVPGVDFEYVEYKNEAGNVIKLRKSKTTGDLLDPVPEGYTFVDPEATKVEETTVAPTTPQTTSVREDKGDADHAKAEEEKYGPGGGRIGLGGFSDGRGLKKDATLVGVSFNNAGTLPGVAGAMQGAFGLISGEGIPEGATATFTLDGETVTVDAPTYNSLKNSGFKGERANSILEELRESKRLTDRSKSMTKDFMSKSKEERRKETAAAVAANEKRVRARAEKAEEIAQTTNKIKQAQAKARAEMKAKEDAAATAARVSREQFEIASGQYQDSGGNDTTAQQAADDYTASAVAEAVSTGDYSRGFNEGGLASKPKPKKTKKMKKGGLASKK